MVWAAMSVAVHRDGELIAFVEVGDRGHGTRDGVQKIKRKYEFKDFLYAHRYPQLVVHHVYNDQFLYHTMAAGAVSLAASIINGGKSSGTAGFR